MRKSELRQTVYDLALEVQRLRYLLLDARDMLERGDYDADDFQRERLRRFMQETEPARNVG